MSESAGTDVSRALPRRPRYALVAAASILVWIAGARACSTRPDHVAVYAGTIASVDTDRVALAVIDGGRSGELWFALTPATRIRRGDVAVADSVEELTLGEAVSIHVNHADEAVPEWGCPHHDQIVQPRKGACPLCRMPLVGRMGLQRASTIVMIRREDALIRHPATR